MMNDASIKNKTLFEIDNRIDELVKRIELLNYVNPINIESEKDIIIKELNESRNYLLVK